MRLAVLAATILACSVLPAMAEDQPAVDLVAKFVLGIAPDATVGLGGAENGVSVMQQSGPGGFTGAMPSTSDPFSFVVIEKSKCIFDVKYTEAESYVAGIEVDANKLSSVTYEKTGEQPPVTEYNINLVGADGVVQLLGPDGGLKPTTTDSTLSTSLSADEMQAAVTAFQAAYCPAAAP